MIVNPTEAWVHVKLQNIEEKKESVVLVPEDFESPKAAYSAVTVITDSAERYSEGTSVVIPTHLICKISVNAYDFFLIERKYIMASLG